MSIAAMKRIQYVVAFGMLGAFLAPSAGQAQTLDINYYTISSNDPDANHLTQGTFTNEVQNALGPNGLPVLNIPLYGCSTNCYSVNGAPGFPSGGSTPNVNVYNPTGEITYWSPSNSSSPTANQYVTETLSTTTALPFNVPQNFFPPNGTGTGGDGGNNGFQAAQLFGTITAPSTEQLSFNIGSDDMAFAYIDNQLVCSDGGVHGSTSVACNTPTISAGTHSFDLFFVDINTTQSGLTFSITSQGVTTSAPPTGAPEIDPGSAASGLMLLLGGLAVLRRRAPAPAAMTGSSG
jgi:fibro-slime domain-containing protein